MWLSFLGLFASGSSLPSLLAAGLRESSESDPSSGRGMSEEKPVLAENSSLNLSATSGIAAGLRLEISSINSSTSPSFDASSIDPASELVSSVSSGTGSMSLTLELSSGGAGSAGGGVGGGDGCCFRGDVLVGIEDLPALCLRRLGGFFTGGGVDGGGGVGSLGFVGAGSVGDGGGGG